MNSPMNIRFFFVLSVVFIISCKSNQVAVAEDFKVVMDKGACFGSCPVYTLEIDNLGNALYDGRRFTDKPGLHKHKLTTPQFQSILDQFDKMNFFSYPEKFRSDIADLPTVSITHTNKGLTKTVSGKDNRPDELLALQRLLESFTKQDGWVSIAPIEEKNTDIAEEEEEEEEAQIIEREIIIQFKPGTIISRWMRDYREYQMYVKKPLTDDKKTWIVQYNTKLINPQVLLHKVQSDSGVASAEFNTKVESR